MDTDTLTMPSRINPSDLPPRFQAQIAAQLGKVVYSQAQPSGPVAGSMLRQSGREMNKTEALFLEHLRATYPGAWVEREPIALKLGNGVRYNPDFIVHEAEQTIAGETFPALTKAYEVKGHMRDDAAVKLKVAAARFPWITFILVWRDRKAGTWRQQIISP